MVHDRCMSSERETQMATHGQLGGGGAKQRKPRKVGSTECLERGSWIAKTTGGSASIVKL